MQYVTIFDDVILTFLPHFPGVLSGLFTAEGADPHEVPLLVAHLVDDGLLVRNPNIA